jgi:hypothetical protein
MAHDSHEPLTELYRKMCAGDFDAGNQLMEALYLGGHPKAAIEGHLKSGQRGE